MEVTGQIHAPARFTLYLGKIATGVLCVGSPVGLIAGLHVMREKLSLAPIPETEPRPLGRPVYLLSAVTNCSIPASRV
jgi:hypothetical protein